ncbi:hypothetical protein Q3C01_08720 [Bradyrhizobium sp. UFLA05-109]
MACLRQAAGFRADFFPSTLPLSGFSEWNGTNSFQLGEEVRPQDGQLLASLGEAAVLHLGDAPGVVQRVAAQRGGLVDPPDRLPPPDCLTRSLAKLGVRRAMDMEPDLSWFGYRPSRDRDETAKEADARFQTSRAEMLDDQAIAEFLRAVEFLSKYPRRKTINRKRGSYGLKHDAERATGNYVANGMLIAAALAMGVFGGPYPFRFAERTFQHQLQGGLRRRRKWPKVLGFNSLA